MPDEFGKKITPEQVQAEYQKMLGYNTAVNLDETVRANENFFIGKQWEGVDAKGLPTPVYNFLKQVVCFPLQTSRPTTLRCRLLRLRASAHRRT